jgi:hypothetical protein
MAGAGNARVDEQLMTDNPPHGEHGRQQVGQAQR